MFKGKLKIAAAATGAAALLFAAACSGTGQDNSAGTTVAAAAGGGVAASDAPASTNGQELKYAVVTHAAAGDPFWDLIKSGAEKAGSDTGVSVSYQGDADPVAQSRFIDSAVADGVNGLIVSMANPEGVKDAVQRATSAGIPVVAMNVGADVAVDYGAITFVGIEPVSAAQGAAKQLIAEGKTHVTCVVMEAGNIFLETTCKTLADTPGLDVTTLQVDGTNLADTQSTIKSQLLADPATNAVVTLGSAIAQAAANAKAEAGSQAIISSYNLSGDTIQMLKDGTLDFTVDQQGFLQGYLPVEILNQKIRYGNTVGGGQPVFTGPEIVTKDTVADVEKFVQEGTR